MTCEDDDKIASIKKLEGKYVRSVMESWNGIRDSDSARNGIRDSDSAGIQELNITLCSFVLQVRSIPIGGQCDSVLGGGWN